MHYGSIGGTEEEALKVKMKANPKTLVTIMNVQKNSF
jgi:hypothetical protein